MSLVLIVLSVLACNRTPAGVGAVREERTPHPTAPADWARRNAQDTGTPPRELRDEAGQPAAGAGGASQRQ